MSLWDKNAEHIMSLVGQKNRKHHESGGTKEQNIS